MLLSWLAERIYAQEHLIIVENVVAFQEVLPLIVPKLEEVGYEHHVVKMSPEQYGWPAHRQRLWVVFVHRKKCELTTSLTAHALQAFHRTLRLDGDVFFMSESCSGNSEEGCGTSGGSGTGRQSASGLTRLTTTTTTTRTGKRKGKRKRSQSHHQKLRMDDLTAAAQMRLEGFIDEEERKSQVDGQRYDCARLVDIAQTPQFGTSMTIVPTLVCNSLIFSFRKRRALSPAEHLAVMGFIACKEAVRCVEGNPSLTACHAALASQDGLSAMEVKKLAGNSMHQVCVGVLMAFLLSHTRPLPDGCSTFRHT